MTKALDSALHAVRTWRDVVVRDGKVVGVTDESERPLCSKAMLAKMIENGWLKQVRPDRYTLTREGMRAWIAIQERGR